MEPSAATKRFLVDDRCLARTLTGIGHYLASLVAHWPANAQVELIGFHHQRISAGGRCRPSGLPFRRSRTSRE